MIRINLLPTKKKRKKAKPVPTYLVASVIILVAVAVVTLYLTFFMKGKIKSLQALKDSNAQKIATLQEKIKEVNSFEALNQKFKGRKQIIEDLRRIQLRPVKILDELSSRLTVGVWLIDMSLSKNDITMSGVGYTNEDVVAFVQNLKESPLFTEVYLHETTQSSVEGVPVYNFRISMKAKV